MIMKNNDSTSMPTPDPLRSRWLQARHLPIYLFVFVSLTTIAAATCLILSRRRLDPREKTSPEIVAKEERAVAETFIPAAIPDEQNFAATPFFESAINKGRPADSSVWPDDYSRAAERPRHYPSLRLSATGRTTGRLRTDLFAWQNAFQQSQSGPANGAEPIEVSATPERAANSAAALSVLEALKPYDRVLKELQAASSRPQSRFNVRYESENPWAILLPHLAMVKKAVQVLSLKTTAELATVQTNEALTDAMLMLRLVDAAATEPMLISQLVRVAGFQLALQPLWEGLADRRWSSTQLKSLQDRVQQFDFIRDFKHVMEAERAWGNLTIGLARDRRSPNTIMALQDSKSKAEPWQLEADRNFMTCPRDWFDQEQRNYTDLFNERLLTGFDVETRRFQPTVSQTNYHFVETHLQDTDNLLKQHLVFARTLLMARARLHLKFAAAQGYADFVSVACALERHRLASGQYPSALDALCPLYLQQLPHDLIDGGPLRYRLTDDGGFVLYSIGWNETDDQGQPAFLASGRSTEPHDGDWVWRYPSQK
ncbi:MAG: hypothetical protein QOF48_220 [Verrucomicrobiota bacterium]|jgi:hypothetical protein